MANPPVDSARLDGRVAVVTGAASGLGRAIADHFLTAGAEVIAVDRDEKALTELAGEYGDKVQVFTADVASVESMRSLSERVLSSYGAVDIVVANAGIEGTGTAIDTTDEVWQRVIDINLKGVWLTSRYFLPKMVDKGSGAIINVASIGGLVGVPGIFPYAASKGGVIGLTRQMAVEYGPAGIRVNAVAPGTTRTPLVERNFQQKGVSSDESLAARAAQTPLRRVGVPSDIAGVVGFLASDASSWMSGQVITIDGGLTAMA